MEAITVEMKVPEAMAPYVNNEDQTQVFERNAMILYPFIQNLTISHCRAAEILGVHKTDLIEFYNSLGLSYLDQSEDELLSDLATMNRVMGSLNDRCI